MCRLAVVLVDCRCFLSAVFLGGARRLELFPSNTESEPAVADAAATTAVAAFVAVIAIATAKQAWSTIFADEQSFECSCLIVGGCFVFYSLVVPGLCSFLCVTRTAVAVCGCRTS